MKRAFASAALLGGCLLAADVPSATPALAPTLGANHAPPSDGVEGGLWMASEQYERLLTQSPRRVRDAALESYLREIVCRLSPDYCDDVRIYVVRTPYFNATMLPNGAMQVWTGLLIRVRDEAQLAAVLGHELGHYLRRHSLEQMEDLRHKSNLLTLFTLGLGAAVVGGGIDAGAANAASLGAQIGTLGSITAFSREHETEADLFGLGLLANTGYDPHAAPTVWQDLIDEDRADDGDTESRSAFFASHPAPEQRMAALREASERQGGTVTVEAAEARQRYLAAVEGHLKEWLADEVALHQPKRSKFLFRRMLEGGFAPGLVSYELGEVSRLEDTSALSEEARHYYEKALTFPDAPPEAHRALGLWHLKAKDPAAARTHFTAYLDAAPGAGDRAMIEYYLTLTGTAP